MPHRASLMLGYQPATVDGSSGTVMSSWPLAFLNDTCDDGTDICTAVETSTEVWETGTSRQRSLSASGFGYALQNDSLEV